MVRDWRGSLWLSASLACGVLLACSGGAFSSMPDDQSGGSDAGGSASGKTSVAGKAGVAAGTGASSSQGGTSGSHAGGGAGSGGRGGVASAGSAGNPVMSDGGDATGGSGPVVPAIPSDGLVYWFKADAGFAESSSGSIWEDQSGNRRHATQALSDFSPTLAMPQGLPLPVVQFDGVDDLMELPEIDLPVDSGVSIFAVAGRGVDSNCSAVIELSNGPEIDDINLGSLGNTFQYEVYSESVQAQENAFPVGAMRLLEVLHLADPDKPLAELRINGTLTASKAIPAPAKVTRSTNFIGHTLYGDCLSTYSGAMAEIIFYSRKVSAAERVVIEKYLMGKWKL
jgi:hypothetical protein